MTTMRRILPVVLGSVVLGSVVAPVSGEQGAVPAVAVAPESARPLQPECAGRVDTDGNCFVGLVRPGALSPSGAGQARGGRVPAMQPCEDAFISERRRTTQ